MPCQLYSDTHISTNQRIKEKKKPLPLQCPRPLKEVIAFGDSWTDVGNAALVTVPGVAPRIKGYYEETRYSEYKLWIEMLSDCLGLPPRTPGRSGLSTLLPPRPCGNTWAWGGSMAASGSVQFEGVTQPVPNLQLEVSEYLATRAVARRTSCCCYTCPSWPRSNLYAIWSGVNNLLIKGEYQPKQMERAVEEIERAMRRLRAPDSPTDSSSSPLLNTCSCGGSASCCCCCRYGTPAHAEAKPRFLILNMPRMGDTPAAAPPSKGGYLNKREANEFSTSYNNALDSLLCRLSREPLFKGSICFVNVYKEFDLIVQTVRGHTTKDKGKEGQGQGENGQPYIPNFFVPGPPVRITNVTDQAFHVFQKTGEFPTNHLYWDDVHFTTQGNQVLAGLVLQSLSSISSISSRSLDQSNVGSTEKP